MTFEVLIYFLGTLVMTSWPVWLVGGLASVVIWPASMTCHPLVRLLARTFLLALILTPSFYGDCMPGFAPAIFVFIYEPHDEWLSHGVMPLFFGWLILFSVPVAIVLFQSICSPGKPHGQQT